ncbi:hypothetical protein HG530_010898 [Fusarium avenaceum]|nr:hypothetical protein HG530_010898 [Fusarium avenaceum]
MSTYDVKNKKAILTGAGSGICLSFARQLLESGCSVVIADVKLLPEAEELVNSWTVKDGSKACAYYHKTDVSDWAQLSSLWDTALEKLGQIDIVCNGAGIYEPPSSTFWNAPGVSPPPQRTGLMYRGQLAMDCNKAAIVSFVKSLGTMRKRYGIRNAAVCPGAVYTPIFHPEYCRDRVRPDTLSLTPDQCASVMFRVLTEEQYGDGNIIETMLIGNRENNSVSVREVPLELLYPTVIAEGSHDGLYQEEEKLAKQLEEVGMRQ